MRDHSVCGTPFALPMALFSARRATDKDIPALERLCAESSKAVPLWSLRRERFNAGAWLANWARRANVRSLANWLPTVAWISFGSRPARLFIAFRNSSALPSFCL